MHDQSPREPDEKNPGHSTGPRTREGKANSSLNRLSHGCRSEQILIPGEDPAEFEFTMNHWFEAYNPQDSIAQNLVEEVGKAHWFLKRNEKRLHQIESSLPLNACDWTAEHHKSLTNFTRYKTTAERAFFRWYKALETHYNREFHRNELADRALARAAELNVQWLNKQEQKTAENLKIQQFAHVFGDDEACATTVAPTNQQIKDSVASLPEPPKLITRLLYFAGGVPSAYEWAHPDLLQREFETIGLQTMLYTDWLDIIECEEAAGDGHLGPAPSQKFLRLPPELPNHRLDS